MKMPIILYNILQLTSLSNKNKLSTSTCQKQTLKQYKT